MRVLVLDDSESALELLAQLIKEVAPQAEVFSFNKPLKLIEFSKEKPCDIAFLDIHMWGKSRLEVAKALKDIYSKINIVFVTAYDQNNEKGFELNPAGYLQKPITKEAVLYEIDNLKYPLKYRHLQQETPSAISTPVFIRTFGNFDIFIGGKPLMFNRLKAKEVLAYLVNRKGSSVTIAEIASVLWEDKEYNRSLQNQTQVIISSMMKTLKENSIGDIIIKERNQISIDRSKIKCDYYDFLDWNIDAVNAYKGEYMTNYNWAEMSTDGLSVE